LNSVYTLTPIFVRFIIMLSSHLHPGLSSGFLLFSFLTKIFYAFLISSLCAACPTQTHLWFDQSNNICWRTQFYETLQCV